MKSEEKLQQRINQLELENLILQKKYDDLLHIYNIENFPHFIEKQYRIITFFREENISYQIEMYRTQDRYVIDTHFYFHIGCNLCNIELEMNAEMSLYIRGNVNTGVSDSLIKTKEIFNMIRNLLAEKENLTDDKIKNHPLVLKYHNIYKEQNFQKFSK